MYNIMLLDTSIATDNLGDYIIMECVNKELEFIFNNNFLYKIPTQVTSFHSYQIWRNSSVVQKYSNCKYKFVGGSNILVKNLLTHFPQWNINIFNYKPLRGCILVGVGAGAGYRSNNYTISLYKKLLNREFYHSVRDERSKKFVESLGLKAINTGCVTMWMLTPEFCRTIPCNKAENVIFTLNGKSNGVDEVDQNLIDILINNYRNVYFWVQGDLDFAYFSRFNNTKNIIIINPSIIEYNRILEVDDIEYVGTRLHAGIYAMRNRKRAIIIAVDERAKEINMCNNLNCIDKDELNKLPELINSYFETKIVMPYDKIDMWKSQFNKGGK